MKPATIIWLPISLVILLSSCKSMPTFQGSKAPEMTEPVNVQTPAPAPTPTLHDLIERDLKANRLSKPKGNNAIEKIEKLRRQKPNDPDIKRFEKAIINRYIELANKRLKQQASPSRADLERALSYLNTARSLHVPSSILDNKEDEILELLDIVIQQEQLKKAREASAQNATEATTQTQTEETLAVVTTIEETAPPDTNPQQDNPNYLALDQEQISNRAQEINLQLDSISNRIIAENATVIIHARSMSDFRYLNASLRTSLYWVDPNFNISAEPHIDEDVAPGVEILVE